MDLADTLRKPESKTLEFKRDLSSPDRFLRAVVAFANTSGGVILIGVEDRSGCVLGVADPLTLEERVANLISDSVRPRLLPDVEILKYRQTQVVAVHVYPSPARPHFIARAGLEAGAFVRVGSTNRRADAALLAEMRRFAGGESFDEGPLPALGPEAVDFRVAAECFAPVRTLTRSNLETLRLLTPHQGRLVPTVGGVLLFGRDRLAHFPDAWIQAGRFGGTDKAVILDHADIRTPLVGAVEKAVAFVEKHALRGVAIGRVRHRERSNLPPVAVREAVVNAVAHADYSQRGAPIRIAIFDDRLEVENPGLLPFGLTLADLPLGVSKLRNRAIGRVLHELGLVEQWGSGIQRMMAACRDAGLAPPTWEEIGIRLRVTIRTDQVGTVTVDPTDRAILGLLEPSSEDRAEAPPPDGGYGRGTRDIAAAIGLSPRATRMRLARLAARGLIRELGTGPHDPRRRYVTVR